MYACTFPVLVMIYMKTPICMYYHGGTRVCVLCLVSCVLCLYLCTWSWIRTMQGINKFKESTTNTCVLTSSILLCDTLLVVSPLESLSVRLASTVGV